jgi:hypothetical protein
MKKTLMFLLLAANCFAADPVRSVRVDLNKQNTPFALEAWQGESATWRVYLYQDGGQWIPSTTNYGGLMGFGTNYADSTSMSLATGQMTIATNWIDFAFTGSKLNTNGIFYAQILVTNATGGKWVFNEGNWSINKSPITGATTPLSLSSVLNWDLYSILGTPPYPTNFLGLSDTPDAYTGQGGKTIAVKGDESGLEFSSAGAGDITAVVAGSGLDGGAVSGVATVALNAASIASLALADTALQPASTQGLITAISGLQSTQETVVAWQGSVSGRLDNAGALTNWPAYVVTNGGTYSSITATNLNVANTNAGSQINFGSSASLSYTNRHGYEGLRFHPTTIASCHDLFMYSTAEGLFLSSIGINGEMFLHGSNYVSMSVGDIESGSGVWPLVGLDRANSMLILYTATNSDATISFGANGFPVGQVYPRLNLWDYQGAIISNAVIKTDTLLASGTNLGSTVAAQGVVQGTLQTSNANLYAVALTNGGTYSALTVTNFTAAGDFNAGGFSITNRSMTPPMYTNADTTALTVLVSRSNNQFFRPSAGATIYLDSAASTTAVTTIRFNLIPYTNPITWGGTNNIIFSTNMYPGLGMTAFNTGWNTNANNVIPFLLDHNPYTTNWTVWRLQ